MSEYNTDLIAAKAAAQAAADALNLAYWSDGQSVDFHLTTAKAEFAKLAALMAKLDAGEEQPREVSNAPQSTSEAAA